MKNTEESWIGTYEKELLDKATEYQIPFYMETWNSDSWLKLIDKIEEWESLVKVAEEYCIDYEDYLNDPVALAQAIEEHEKANNSRNYFFVYDRIVVARRFYQESQEDYDDN